MEHSKERLDQFRADIESLGLKAPGDASERPWQVAGTALVIAAFVVIAVGWWGASGTTRASEQLPYLISGGMLGVALAAVGGALMVRSSLTRYLRFWFIRMIYEERVQTDRTVEALERLAAGRPASGAAATGGGAPSDTDASSDAGATAEPQR